MNFILQGVEDVLRLVQGRNRNSRILRGLMVVCRRHCTREIKKAGLSLGGSKDRGWGDGSFDKGLAAQACRFEVYLSTKSTQKRPAIGVWASNPQTGHVETSGALRPTD